MNSWRKYQPHLFLVFFLIIVLIIIGHNFERYYVAKDYMLHVFTTCDSTNNSCFVADPSTADPTFQSGMYEKVRIDAAHAPNCLQDHTCTNFSCTGLGNSCLITYCSPKSLEDGESCTTKK